tara:strand:- start:4357 stop:4878 length:522 start_codon:yes stop_codon:yes gene_type:complete
MKKVLVLLPLAILLSCSLNTKNTTLTKEQIERKFDLDKEITIEEANETVLGPLDKDGIRIDIKRKIVFAAPTDSIEDVKTRNVYERFAQIWTEMIYNQDNRDKLLELDYERAVINACVYNGYVREPKELKSFYIEFINGSMEKAIVYDKIHEQLDVYHGRIPEEVYKTKCDSL